jgi:hypothetical protein
VVPEPHVFYCFSTFFFFYSVLLTLSSLISYPYSYPLHFPSFSHTTIHCSPSQLLFLPLLIHSFPCLHLLILSSPKLSPHYLPSYTLTTCCLAYCTSCTQPQPLQSLTQTPSTATEIHQTHIRTTKPSSLHTSSPTYPPFIPCPPF